MTLEKIVGKGQSSRPSKISSRLTISILKLFTNAWNKCTQMYHPTVSTPLRWIQSLPSLFSGYPRQQYEFSRIPGRETTSRTEGALGWIRLKLYSGSNLSWALEVEQTKRARNSILAANTSLALVSGVSHFSISISFARTLCARRGCTDKISHSRVSIWRSLALL